MPLHRILWAAAGLALFSGACSGGDSGSPGPGPSSQQVAKAAQSGDAQTGTVGQPLAQPLRVQVTRDGSPEAGVTVNWSTTGVNATLNPASGTTAADGTASTQWTLGQGAGPQTAQASVPGAGGSPVGFSATAQPGPAAALTKSSGDNQTGVSGSPLPQSIVARVADQFGNPVTGTTVQWTVTGGGGSVNPVSGGSNQQGLVSTTWTLGAVDGPNALQAAATGLSGSPLTFNATGVTPPPPPSAITIQVDNNFFSPQVDTVAAGGTVTWNWVGQMHNVTSVLSPAFASSTTQSAPFTYGPITFMNAGTYEYICTIHGSIVGQQTFGMRGTIVVQ
ncbi:MAG: hypothetical protein AB7I33_10150 [Gemmatimonadales bacterium]